jgi:predicted TIM-barrel fold metal-dependent hydrolase
VYIIDTHIHIGKSDKLSRFWTLQDYLVLMDTMYIDCAVVMPNITSTSFYNLNNDFMDAIFALNNNRFLPFLLLDIYGKTNNQIDIYQNAIKGAKYHPSCSRKTIDTVDLSIPDFLPILVHCGRDPLSSVDYLINAALKYPNKKFIAAHMAGMTPDVIEPSLSKIKESKVSNIWLDISAVNLPWMIEVGCSILGEDRFLFGSDEPFQDVRLTESCLYLANIPERSKEKVFYENAKFLFGL